MNKKGISLIVLVITIIVMIILAATVAITLSNSGIINRADDATNATNIAALKQQADLTILELTSEKGRYPTQAAAIYKLGQVLEGSTTEDDIITTKDEQYDIIITPTLDVEVEKHIPKASKYKITTKYINESGEEIQTSVVNEYDAGIEVAVALPETLSGKDLLEFTIEKANGSIVALDTTKMSVVDIKFLADQNLTITGKYGTKPVVDDTPSETPTTPSTTKSEVKVESSHPVEVKTLTSTEINKLPATRELEAEEKREVVDVEPVVTPAGKIMVTFDVTDMGAEDGDFVEVSHYNGRLWDKLGIFTVASGKITVEIDSFSPFELILMKAKNQAVPPPTTEGVAYKFNKVYSYKYTLSDGSYQIEQVVLLENGAIDIHTYSASTNRFLEGKSYNLIGMLGETFVIISNLKYDSSYSGIGAFNTQCKGTFDYLGRLTVDITVPVGTAEYLQDRIVLGGGVAEATVSNDGKAITFRGATYTLEE